MSELRAIAPWEIPMHWNRMAEMLLPVLQRDEVDNSLEDVHQLLLAGSMQAWQVGWETILVTQIQPYGSNPQAPTKRVCCIVFCAGRDMDRWLDPVVAFLAEWARSLGCSSLRVCGRWGWLRELKHLDFKDTGVLMEKRI